jgi:hypothetical protein
MTFSHRRNSWVHGLAAASVALVLALSARDTAAQDKPLEVIVYPILVEAPIYGASIDLPTLPIVPPGSEGSEQRGSTDVSLNTLYMAGAAVRANRWFVEARGQWADLSATRSSPGVTVDTKARFFTIRGGPTFGPVSVTAGLRRVSGTLSATLELPALGETVSGQVDPVLYDPLVGVDWRHRAGAFYFESNLQAGGFGVGTDRDVSGEFDINWRFTPHTEIRLGYGFLYYKISSDNVTIGAFSRQLESSQTLHGPIAGFAIVF